MEYLYVGEYYRDIFCIFLTIIHIEKNKFPNNWTESNQVMEGIS